MIENIFNQLLDLITEDLNPVKSLRVFYMSLSMMPIEPSRIDDVALSIHKVLHSMNFVDTLLNRNYTTENFKIDQVRQMIENHPICTFLSNISNQMIYTMSILAKRLIHQKRKKKAKDDICNYLVLKGGIQDRFIPFLSEKTRNGIRSFYKIL